MGLPRLPEDPSDELIELIRTLQHTCPTDELYPVPMDLYAQAHNWIVRKGVVPKAKTNEPRVNTLLCGHWISPAFQ